MCNFENDTQALFALIDLHFATNVNPQIQTVIAKCDNKGQEFYLQLAQISEAATSIVLSSLSNKYKSRLAMYYSLAGLTLFVRQSHDFKIKEVITTNSRN